MIITVTQESRYCAEAFFNDEDTRRDDAPVSSKKDKITINRYSYIGAKKTLVDTIKVQSATEIESGYKCIKNGQPIELNDGEFNNHYSFWLKK